MPGSEPMYQLLDAGNFQKLEQLGPYRLVRPAAQAVWRPHLPPEEWAKADALFTRFSGGDGKWEVKNRRLTEGWRLDVPGLGQLVIKLTDFGHLGLFPEQHANWQRLTALVKSHVDTRGGGEGQPFQVLNLFAYTGGSTLAAARGGAQVVHLDASKTSVAWARENAEACGLASHPIRWIVDDVQKFVAREVRRGSRYHGIILDPPSYGRGTGGEVWKIEDHLPPLLDHLQQILADDHAFVLLSCHSEGYTPIALRNLLSGICSSAEGDFEAAEMTVVESEQGRMLPSGAYCYYIRRP